VPPGTSYENPGIVLQAVTAEGDHIVPTACFPNPAVPLTTTTIR